MRALRLHALLALTGALGCGEEGALSLRAELPVTEAHRSVIVGIERTPKEGAVSLEVRAARILEDGTINPILSPLAPEDRLRLTGRLYTAPLDRLGLSEGALSPAEGGPLRPLPQTPDRYGAQLEDGELSGWAALDALPDGLASFRLPALQSCTRFAVRTSTSPLFADVDFVMAVQVQAAEGLTGQGALMSTGDELYYFEEGRFIPLDRPDSEPCGGDVVPARYRGGYQAPDGSLWLTARCGEIWRVNLNLAARRIEGAIEHRTSHRDSAGTIVGPREGTPTELFTLGLGNGIWERLELESRSSDVLFAFEVEDGGYGAQAFVGEGDVLALWEGRPELVRYQQGEVSFEPLPGFPQGLTAVAHHPGFGTILGAEQGQLLLQRPGEDWRMISEPGLLTKIRDIAPYERSFVYLDGDRSLRQYASETGSYCEPIPIDPALPDRARFITVIGRNILLIGNDEGGVIRYRWLVPLDP